MQDNRRKLMSASFLTLITAGVGFAVRAGILSEWGSQFGFTQSELGTITGGGLVGFGVVILAASLITDRLGYKTILGIAFFLHILSVVITVGATPVYAAAGKAATFQCLYWGMFCFAVANGLCETAINPLIANIYSEKKTHYLNILHAGWPGGLIVGGLLAKLLVGNVRWEIPIALYLVPTLWYGVIVLKEEFPKSDVAKAGISFVKMLKEFASPILICLLLLQVCVGYVELGTDSWITNITESLLSGQGLFLFIYASAIMFVLRFFAGPIVERINPLGLLCASTVLGATGLFLLGSTSSAGMIWLAVTIYGFGKTFLWPTMLGVVGERFPRGGAITMGAVGAAGALAGGFMGGPGIGYQQDYNASAELKQSSQETYDRYAAADENGFLVFPKVRGLDGRKVGVLLDDAKTLNTDYAIFADPTDAPDDLKELKDWWDETGQPNAPDDKGRVENARIFGGQMALKLTAIVPATMFVGYLLLVLYFRSRGGYSVVQIDESRSEDDSGSDT
ncbi:MAG TPA: MFS transporter [Planctomycetes bacterium]|nr:MFS transporter [Fuerstiella sp.]HIK95017.1 MFS transporter [Planctomycetota bacterium]